MLAAFTQPGDHFSAKLCTHKAFICSSRNVVVAAFEARAWTYSCEAANSRCMRAALEGETGATQMSEAQCKLECKQEGGRQREIIYRGKKSYAIKATLELPYSQAATSHRSWERGTRFPSKQKMALKQK